MTETTAKDAKSGMNVRSLTRSADETWTVTEYGDRLFSIGGSFFGPQTEMFKLAISCICIDGISQDVAKTPLYLRKRTPRGWKIVEAREHPVAAMLEGEVNPFHNGRYDFLRELMTHHVICSEVFAAGRRSRQNELLEVVPIPRSRISDRSVNVESREWFYDVSPSTNHDRALFGWASGRQSSNVVTHIRHRSLSGDQVLSTRTLSGSALALLESMHTYQSGSFSNNGIPPLAFSFPDELTDTQFERLTEGFARAVAKARKEGKPVILEGSDGEVPQVHKIAMSATDTDFIKANMNAANDVIRYFRYPPHKAFLFDSIKYDNLAGAERLYVEDTLAGYYNDLIEGLGRVMLTKEERREYKFWFDSDQAYTMDPTERQKVVESKWKNGMLETDQMLLAIGENTIGGKEGRVRMMSGNFVLVNEKNEVVMRAGGNAPGADPEDTPKDAKEDEPKKGLRLVESK